MREKGVEMDWKQTERSGVVLGTGKDRIDDGLEHRERSGDGLGTGKERIDDIEKGVEADRELGKRGLMMS
jgi:hypothetical protein